MRKEIFFKFERQNRSEDISKSSTHTVELHKKNQSNWAVHTLTTILPEKFCEKQNESKHLKYMMTPGKINQIH